MSQFPNQQYPQSPYQVPQPLQSSMHPYAPGAPIPADVMRPARWAGAMLITLSVVLILLGGCFSVVGVAGPNMQLPAETKQRLAEIQRQTGQDIFEMMAGFGVMLVIPAIAGFILSPFVLRGRNPAIIIALILTGIGLIVNALFILGGIIGVSRNPSAALSLCMMIIPAVLLISLFVLLIKALGSGKRADAIKQQMQAQYAQAAQWWQYQQQQAWAAHQAAQQPAVNPNQVPPPQGPSNPPAV